MMLMNRREIRVFIRFWLVIAALMILAAWLGAAYAAELPQRSATKHRAELTRAAYSIWGLDAPIPVFAAQIHQESGWNPQALSKVGAQGMAQFMPDTAKWWCEINQLSAAECLPNNPSWAMRSLIGYDLWLYQRVRGNNEYDRLWAALRSYNGGLGHWQNEAAIVRPSLDRRLIDSACGKSRRHVLHCRENLNYPHRILNVYQPRYFGWGRGVMMTGGAA